jgi:hypothetical protein
MGEQMKATITEDGIAQAGYSGNSLRDASEHKISRIRRQLKEGKYNLDERLEIAIKRILEEVCR